MTQKFLDLAGLVALWAKIKALITTVSNSIGNGALKVSSNSGTATLATTMNLSSDKTLLIKGDGTWISGAVSGSADAAVVTLSHGGPSTGSELTTSNGAASAVPNAGTEVTVLTGVTASADSKGHITGVSTTRLKIKTPADGTFSVKTKTGSNAAVTAADFTANQSSADDVTFIAGLNITLTTDTTNRTITITASDAPEQVAPNDATLTVNGDTGTQVAFSADEESAKDLSIVGDNTLIGTAVTSGTDETIVTVSHKTPTGGSAISEPTTTPSTYNAANSSHKLLSSLTLTANNGHITAVTPTYVRIENATESMPGLMSAADKTALNGMLQAIANALTSAITPKGSKTATEFVTWYNGEPLSSQDLGSLYLLTSPLVIGASQSGDVTMSYSNFVEGTSLTNNGTVRHEIPAGSYIMVVNTGTTSNPEYKLDIVSGLYDFSQVLKAIPVDTSDADYDGPNTTEDPTIESICV